jgi:hypothetical protein
MKWLVVSLEWVHSRDKTPMSPSEAEGLFVLEKPLGFARGHRLGESPHPPQSSLKASAAIPLVSRPFIPHPDHRQGGAD